MTSFVLRLPFRVIDLTAYSGDLWYSPLKTVPSGAFFSLRCLIYKVHASSAEHCYSIRSSFICQPLFSSFLKIFCGASGDLSDSFVRIPPIPPFVNTIFHLFSPFLFPTTLPHFLGTTFVQNRKGSGQFGRLVL